MGVEREAAAAMSGGKKVQSEHRRWNEVGLEARAEKQVLERLDRIVRRSPRPRAREAEAKWQKRSAAYLKEFRGFFKQHGKRLLALGIRIEDFGIIDPSANTMPIEEPDVCDPRHTSAEERDILKEIAERGVVRYRRLG